MRGGSAMMARVEVCLFSVIRREVEPEQEESSSFPQTRWTLIRSISEGDSNQRQRALEDLGTVYWPPIYAYILARGHNSHDPMIP